MAKANWFVMLLRAVTLVTALAFMPRMAGADFPPVDHVFAAHEISNTVCVFEANARATVQLCGDDNSAADVHIGCCFSLCTPIIERTGTLPSYRTLEASKILPAPDDVLTGTDPLSLRRPPRTFSIRF